jgi:hypothetical protein
MPAEPGAAGSNKCKKCLQALVAWLSRRRTAPSAQLLKGSSKRPVKPQRVWRSERSAARANILAIARTDWPSTMPRDISSRSAIVSARRGRRRAGGMIPPLGLKCAKLQEDGLPKARPIDFRPSPFFQRSQSSALCAA